MGFEEYLRRVGTPVDGDTPYEHVAAGELPPPEPLTRTLEKLERLGDDEVLVQTNDRVPQHLYPKLEERGYGYETYEDEEDGVVTVIWSKR